MQLSLSFLFAVNLVVVKRMIAEQVFLSLKLVTSVIYKVEWLYPHGFNIFWYVSV